MREIKFRGYDVSLNLWRYGSLRMMNGGCEISWFNDDGIYYARFVKSETVGQYIGRKDRNSEKIYEDDIEVKDIFDGKKYVGYVKYCEDGATFAIRIDYENDERHLGIEPQYMEIIGNLHENPELIEQKKEDKK